MPTTQPGPGLQQAIERGLIRTTALRPARVRTPALPAGCSERVSQAAVIRLATEHGWHCYHTHDSRRPAAGFPTSCEQEMVC
jgi:hypothetical protein